MKQLIIPNAVCAFSLLSSVGLSAPSPNLIQCKMVNVSGVAQCSVDRLVLLPQQSYEVTASVRSEFLCGPGDKSAFRIGGKAEREKFFVTLGQSEQFSITGVGPFEIFDDNVAETFSNIFNPGCSLTFDLLSVEPSTVTKTNWQSRKSDLAISIPKTKSALDAFTALAAYAPAFALLKQVSENLAKDLSQNLTLRKKLEVGTPERDLLEEIVFKQVDIRDSTPGAATHTVSKDQKKSVLGMLNYIDGLPDVKGCSAPTPSSACTAQTLEQYLGDAQKKQFEDLVQYEDVVSKAADNQKVFAQDLLLLEQQELELCLASKAWIVWDTPPIGCMP